MFGCPFWELNQRNSACTPNWYKSESGSQPRSHSHLLSHATRLPCCRLSGRSSTSPTIRYSCKRCARNSKRWSSTPRRKTSGRPTTCCESVCTRKHGGSVVTLWLLHDAGYMFKRAELGAGITACNRNSNLPRRHEHEFPSSDAHSGL